VEEEEGEKYIFGKLDFLCFPYVLGSRWQMSRSLHLPSAQDNFSSSRWLFLRDGKGKRDEMIRHSLDILYLSGLGPD
jgi:hypothetical protein